jgi:phosphoribosylformylglycinamidine synthase PurS subunit
VARVVVDVMLKPEILDPQGKAVHGAFGRLGFDGVADVRQGKRFEITLDGEATEERVAEIRKAAETLLANPVIEDFAVHVDPDPTAEATDEAGGDGDADEAEDGRGATTGDDSGDDEGVRSDEVDQATADQAGDQGGSGESESEQGSEGEGGQS